MNIYKGIAPKLKKAGWVNMVEVHKERMKDPEYRKCYDALEIKYALKHAMIEARIKRRLTQADIAKRAGTKQSAISRFERGASNPTLDFIQKLCHALDLKLTITPTKR